MSTREQNLNFARNPEEASLISRAGAKRISGVGKVPAGNGRNPLISPAGLTRKARLEVKRRRNILETYHALKQKGLSNESIAKELRVGVSTIWRYQKRIEPLTANCGRKTALEHFNPPALILSLVRKLQLGGKTNAAAWRAVAADPRCPKKLSDYLRSTRNIAKSLLAVTRLVRRSVQVIEAPEFLIIIKPKQPTL